MCKTDDARAAALATTLERFEVIAPEIQARLRDNFMREASPWLVGGDMSLADVAWYAALHEIATIQALGAPPAAPAPDDTNGRNFRVRVKALFKQHSC